MHTFQHQRWNQWSLFFFGSIISLFALWAQLKTLIPLWIPALLALVVSVSWVFTALGIRATNRVWEDIVKELESDAGQEIKPHHELTKLRGEFSIKKELFETLKFWDVMTRYSVSRHLVWFGFLSCAVFIGLLIFGIIHPYLPDSPSGTGKATTTTTTTTTEAATTTTTTTAAQ
jgi:hypothetical protein